MMSFTTGVATSKFVSTEVFNAYVKNLNSRIEAEEKLNDLRMDRIEAIIGESNATINGGINLLNERLNKTNDRIDNLEARLNASIDNLEARLIEGLKSTNDRIDNLEARLNDRIDSLEARLVGGLKSTNDRIDNTNQMIDNLERQMTEQFRQMDHMFNEKLEHVVDTLSVAVAGTDQRITDMKEDVKAEQNKSLAKWGIGVALFVGAVQVVVSVVLHFLH